MLKVLKAGLYTSIQDLGRCGFMKYGVPISGAMDQYAATKANLLLNNKPNFAVIECTQIGPKLLFNQATQIAICGANITANINQHKVSLNSLINIEVGDILNFGALIYGYRTYIAVKGGFETEQILESNSYYQPITNNNILVKDDEIAYKAYASITEKSNSAIAVNVKHFSNQIIQVHKGPEFDLLDKEQQDFLLSANFHIAINNRMAYQLKEQLANSLPSILTSAILPGTVQLTPLGKIIILMRDAQTTGGYPRILNLPENSINTLSQKKLGDVVKFVVKPLR